MTDLEMLCAELTCGDDLRAEQAARRLPDFGSAAIKALRSLIKDDDVDVRWWTVRALAGFNNRDETTVDLLGALKDESAEVRQAAAMAFCHKPDIQALTQLIELLSDPDPMTARLASNAMILLGTDATSALLDVLKTGKHPARREAIRALAEIKDPLAIPGLMAALETDSVLMQYWAGLGLDKMGVGMVYLKPE